MNDKLWSRHALTLCLAAGLLLAMTARAEETPKEKPPAPAHVRLGMVMSPTGPAASELKWLNGEKAAGELVGALENELTWKSQIFSEPMRLQRESLRQVDFGKSSEPAAAEGEFRILLTDGSNLSGTLQQLTESELSFKLLSGETITTRWEHLVAVERMTGGDVVKSGTSGLVALGVDENQNQNRGDGGNKFTPWYLEPGGLIASPSFNAAAKWDVPLPDRCVLDLSISTAEIPSFSVELGNGTQAVSVETWQDELVLVQGTRYATASVRPGPELRKLRLRLAWDQNSRQVVLYGPDGSVWGELAAPLQPVSLLRPDETPFAELDFTKNAIPEIKIQKPKSTSKSKSKSTGTQSSKSEGHITLRNKGNGMIVERMEISRWSGQPVPALLAAPVCIETSTAHLAGEPVGKSAAGLMIRQPDGQARELDLATVHAIRWGREARLDQDSSLTSMWFSDGQFVRGKLVGIKDGRATLETSFAPEPITIALKACRALVLPQPNNEAAPPSEEDRKKAFEKLDHLTTTRGALHGTMEWGGGKLPRFRPVGGVEALAPVVANELTMKRRTAEEQTVERAPALLHVKSGETFPVSLTGISRDKVEFAWPAAGKDFLATSDLHAIQFVQPRVATQGFEGAEWQSINSTKPTIKDKIVTIPPGGGIGHPFALQGEDISFKLERVGRGSTLRIRLFTSSLEQKTGTTNFLISDMGTLYFGPENEQEGQFDDQLQIPKSTGPIEVRLTFPEDRVEMWVNGIRTQTNNQRERDREVKVKKSRGPGIVLESTSLWGNQTNDVKVSDFQTVGTTFNVPPPIFSEDAKREALLLPRVHRESPPRHILIGRNGDLLRGEIESMSDSSLLFRAGLETFKVPRDRVTSAVWVAKAEKGDAKEPPPEAEKTGEDADQPQQAAPDPFAPPVKSSRTAPKPAKKVPDPPVDPENPVQWIDLVNGGRVRLAAEAWNADFVTGEHPLLGACKIPLALIDRLSIKVPGPSFGHAALANWKFVNTKDPVLPGDENTASPLVGKEAADFSIPMLTGGTIPLDKIPGLDPGNFTLKEMKGKVVVLDFWATWCGPCVKSLPGLVNAMKDFPEDRVAFLAVNQGETLEQVRKFLDTREISTPVGFDATQSVARKYGVEGIPHTVVIDRDGKIALVKTGYSPEGEKEITAAVEKALE